MSYDVALYTGAGSLVRDARRTGQAISRIQCGGQVRQATVDAEADVTTAKLQAGYYCHWTGARGHRPDRSG